MAQIVSLEMMRQTVRRLTARYVEEQMSSTQIDGYINRYYTLFFPEEFKNLKLTKPYTFLTVPNVDTYAFVYQNGMVTSPSGAAIPGNIQLSPPAYCQGYLLRYYQDKTTFYNQWPKLTVNQQIGTTSIGLTTYSGTIPSAPFLRSQLDINGNVTESAVIFSVFDNTGYTFTMSDVPQINSNVGLLIGTDDFAYGTINYFTGAYSFAAALNPGASIYASVVPYQSSRPTDVIFYNQQITLRPVPQQVYQVEFQISQQPTDLIADNDAPELNEWYLLLCAGAAKLIYADFPDPEGLAYLMPIWQEQIQLAQRRTLRQMSGQRAQTIFSQPGRPMMGYYMGNQYSGGS